MAVKMFNPFGDTRLPESRNVRPDNHCHHTKEMHRNRTVKRSVHLRRIESRSWDE